MASFESAQATFKCDHCKKEEDVKHQCLDCDEMICFECKAIHSNARATKDHKVVLIEERHSKNHTSSFCKEHPDKMISLHCNSCNFPVCIKCVRDAHNDHNISEISTILEKYKQDVEDSKKPLEDQMKKINALIHRGQTSWQDYENTVGNIESQIGIDIATRHSLVDRMGQTTKDELNKIKTKDEASWENAKQNFQREKSLISNCLEQHDRYLSSPTIYGKSEILEQSHILLGHNVDQFQIAPPSYQSHSQTHFEGVGIIRKNETKTILEFPSNLKGYPFVAYGEKNNILLISTDSKDLHYLDKQGQSTANYKLKDRSNTSLAVFKSGEIVLSVNEGQIEILKKGKQKTVYTSSNRWNINFVSVTEKQELLICKSKTYRYCRFEGCVILCDSEGKIKRSIGGDCLYHCPIQAIDVHGNGFCVSDVGKQQLVMLDIHGKVMYTLRNPLGRDLFHPRGICTDRFGNILVCDDANDCVYIIDKEMSIKELIGKTEGIKEPRCVCIDGDDKVWIAQYNGNIRKIEYL